MPADDRIEHLLERMDERQVELLVAVTKNTQRLDKLNEDVTSIFAELGGVPDPTGRGARQTLRWRVHNLENEQNAARLIKSAQEELQQRESQVWSRRQKILLFIFAAGAFLEGFIRPVLEGLVHLIRNAGAQ